MISGLGPIIVQALAVGAAQMVGESAAKAVWDRFIWDKDRQKEFNETSVRWLQVSLKLLGYKLTVTGNYGDYTEKAVRLFQARTGIDVDGVAGDKTLKAIVQELERRWENDESSNQGMD